MHEIKSVKVDNWGVFFLQKLQNFFNKTDYCDLTLQFKDNSQLKVHRLVLSACTDFFNVLESRYEVVDDVLIMPKDLQADVVVPIVNFMYTGTLEFEVNMYARLLKTAKDMNMTVLLKLLEAHKRTVGDSIRSQQSTTSSAPIVLNKGAQNQRGNTYSRPMASGSVATTSARTYTPRRQQTTTIGNTKISPTRISPGNLAKIKSERIERTVGSTVVRTVPASSTFLRKNLPEPVQLVAKYANSPASTSKGPSRFECADDLPTDAFETSFDNISYESKPLITASQLKEEKSDHEGSFEKLKRGGSGGTKRTYSGTSTTAPPEKKPNLQEIKEYAEHQRQRDKLVAEELDDDADCFGDDFQNNDDDDDDYEPPASAQSSSQRQSQIENASVVVKSDGTQPVNHAKIISEVLKKYPHLVKNNKNIKLKIMQKGNQAVTVSAVSKEPQKTSPATRATTRAQATQPTKVVKKVAPPQKEQPATVAVAAAPPANQPKKIDSRTMHELIAKGAENMTGPWLCLECGVNGRPISIPSYRGFRRHLINVHKQRIDQRLCEHCGWRSKDRNELFYHLFTKHNIKPPVSVRFAKCPLCDHVAIDQTALIKHKREDHQAQSSQQVCIYCSKTFPKELLLYSHMRNAHKKQAKEDGILDTSDDETCDDDADKYVPNNPEPTSATSSSDNKIKVLSNIALPSKAPLPVVDSSISSTENINLEPSSEAEGLSNVASGIATSLAVLDTNLEGATYTEDLQSSHYIEAAMANVHGENLDDDKKHDSSAANETKFITEEGSELQLTAQQKAELLEQLQDQTDGLNENVVMVLNESYENQSDTGSQHDSSGIVLVSTNKDESVESDANASTEIQSADESMESTKDSEPKDKPKAGTKNLISALEGDWSENDDAGAHNEEDDDAAAAEEEEEEENVDEKEEKKIKATKAKPEIEKKSPKVDDEESTKDETKKERKASSEKNMPSLILDDWSSQPSDKNDEDDEKSEAEKSIEKMDTEDDDEKPTEKEKSVEKKVESKNADEGIAEDATDGVEVKKEAQSKSDIKTLISDWGDDDEGF